MADAYEKNKVNPPKVLVLGLLSIIMIGTALLRLPLATVSGQPLSWTTPLGLPVTQTYSYESNENAEDYGKLRRSKWYSSARFHMI